MNLRSGKGRSGFTLLEIMVAMFLLAIVVAAVYSSWRAVARGSQTGLKAAAQAQRSRMAVRALEDALTCARSFAASPEYYVFEAENGNDAWLSFVAKLPPSYPRSGKFGEFDVRRLTFALEPDPEEGSQLVLRQNPILMDIDADEKEHPIVLARGVRGFEMEFWDQRRGEWLEEWTVTNQLPPMLKVTLELGGPKGQSGSHQKITRTISIPAPTVPANAQTPGRSPFGPGGGNNFRGGPGQ